MESESESDGSEDELPKEVTLDTYPPADVEALRELYGGDPPGRLLKGTYGVTHFVLDEPSSGEQAKIAVLAHGIGTSTDLFNGFRTNLLAAGFRVLRYDFIGHAWSHAAKTAHYDDEMFDTQVSELLDHVLPQGVPVDLFVGHSTGGLVGTRFALHGTRPILNLALISAAFWAKKPPIAQAAESAPTLVQSLLRTFPCLGSLTEDTYLKNNDLAYAHDGKNYFHPEKHEAAAVHIKRMFALHPQITAAITGVNFNYLRGDLLAKWRDDLAGLVASSETEPRVCIFWGDHDVVVPFEHHTEVLEWQAFPGRVTFVPLVDLGHDSPSEDPEKISTLLVQFGQRIEVSGAVSS